MTIKTCKWCEQRYVGYINDNDRGFCSIECETIFREQESHEKEALDDNTRTD